MIRLASPGSDVIRRFRGGELDDLLRRLICLAGTGLFLLSFGSEAADHAKSVRPVHHVSVVTGPLRSVHFNASDGTRLHVIEGGPVTSLRPVIAFVPGWSMPARLWRDQMERLMPQYRVAALDPRGQGESALPDSGFNLDRRSDDIAEFVMRYPRVVLVAWSLAALESLHLLAQPRRAGAVERIAGFVVVDSSVGEGPDPAPVPAEAGFASALRRNRAEAVESFVRAIFSKPYYEPALLALRDEALRMPLESSIALFPSVMPRRYWREAIREYPGALLYAYTTRFEGQAKALRESRPRTRFAEFPDAGHALFIDDGDAFHEALRSFLSARELFP